MSEQPQITSPSTDRNNSDYNSNRLNSSSSNGSNSSNNINFPATPTSSSVSNRSNGSSAATPSATPVKKSSLRDRVKLEPLAPLKIKKNPEKSITTELETEGVLGYATVNGETFECTDAHLTTGALLGKGAYGYVYKMTHNELGHEMAVKQIRDSSDEKRRKQLVTDLKVIRRCQCPFIVTYYGFHFTEGEIWIYMELAMKSLDFMYENVKKSGHFIEEQIMRKICYSVLQGLTYLKKEHNIMYRDLKPSNVLLAYDGSIKLCDFGISKVLEKQSSYAKTATGCERYLPPERLDPATSKEEYDIRSDVWAFGLTLVELAILKYPYPESNNVFQIMKAIVHGEPPSIPSDGRYCDAFTDFVNQCLQKDKRDRPKFDQSPENKPTKPCLLEHPYVKGFSDEDDIDVAEWYSRIVA